MDLLSLALPVVAERSKELGGASSRVQLMLPYELDVMQTGKGTIAGLRLCASLLKLSHHCIKKI